MLFRKLSKSIGRLLSVVICMTMLSGCGESTLTAINPSENMTIDADMSGSVITGSDTISNDVEYSGTDAAAKTDGQVSTDATAKTDGQVSTDATAKIDGRVGTDATAKIDGQVSTDATAKADGQVSTDASTDTDTYTELETLTYAPTDKYLNNPYIGLGCWADEEMDALKKFKQDFSLVYADIRWSELEPEEGQYDFESFEERCRFDYWEGIGKHAILRLVLDMPDDEMHMDIPKWLYDMTESGEFYDTEYGKGYCPDYSDEVLIEAHAKVLNAIAERYDENDFVAYVQLGSVGHWGEWHVHDDIDIKLSGDTYDQYIDQYVKAFQNTPLLMRRPFTHIKDVNVGLYNDSAGLKEATDTWLGWIAEGGAYEGQEDGLTAMPDRWKTAPIGGELSSLITDKGTLLGDDFENQLNTFRQAHTSWIAPGSFVKYETKNETEAENLRILINTIGYRYYVSSVKLLRSVSEDKDGYRTEITLKNIGTAPIYFPWRLKIKTVYEDGREELRGNPIDIRTVLPDEDALITIESFDEPKEVYIGIFDADDGGRALKMAMDAEHDGSWYRIK